MIALIQFPKEFTLIKFPFINEITHSIYYSDRPSKAYAICWLAALIRYNISVFIF